MIKLTPIRIKIMKTCNLYLLMFIVGVMVAIPGPTLLDLQHVVGTDTEHIALIYTTRSGGYLIGSLIGGVLFDYFSKRQPLLILFNVMITVSALLTPWCRDLIILTVVCAFGGLGMGAIDTGANVFCLNIWGKDNGPYYQALHFTFGVGGLAAPLIAAPFLGADVDSQIEMYKSENDTNYTTSALLNTSELGTNNTEIPDLRSSILAVTYTYSLIGILSLIITVPLVVAFILAPDDNTVASDEQKPVSKINRRFVFLLVGLGYILLSVETGTEIAFAQMLATYAVKGNLKLSKATGSYLTSAFWGALTFARGVSIFLAIKFSNLQLMVGDLVLIIFSSVMLICFASYQWCLWAFTIILGAGLASFYPSTIGWLDEYINVTNKIASLFIVGVALGEMVIPLIIGAFITTVPEVLFYLLNTSTCLTFLTTLVLYLLLKKKPKKC